LYMLSTLVCSASWLTRMRPLRGRSKSMTVIMTAERTIVRALIRHRLMNPLRPALKPAMLTR
ncbi:MAG: hypothetical protein ACI9MB_002388, partial [Verrucomicrobiales bacterium]